MESVTKSDYLSNNYSSALGQLKSLQRRLNSNEQLLDKYNATTQSDLTKGFASVLTSEELKSSNQGLWYVPHHPVLNPNKPDKMRRICNAASNFHGLFMNDTLQGGPELLANLMGILARFRQEPFALRADIEEMFLKVEVRAEDRDYLRFLWQTADGNIQTYRYNRHTFRAKSSPSCANFALQKYARDNADYFVLASQVTQNNSYKDDLLVSFEIKEEAIILKKDLTDMLARCGFNLTK